MSEAGPESSTVMLIDPTKVSKNPADHLIMISWSQFAGDPCVGESQVLRRSNVVAFYV